jgi:hypothetical protein
MNRYRQIVFAILFGTLLLGCTPVEVTPTTPATAAAPVQVTRQTPTATARSSTLTPTATQPLPTATSMPEATATIRPSLTPRPSATPVPTATPRPVHYDLPAWLSDPDAVVLLTMTAADDPLDDYVLTFNNLVTGERFNMPLLSEQTSSIQWYQDETGTYIEQGFYGTSLNPNPPIEQINIATGELRVLPPLEDIIGASIPSPGGRYAVRITNSSNPETIMMEDRETGLSFVLSDPFDGRYSSFAEVSWSPAGDFLAFLRYAFADEPYSPPATGLVIYRPDGSIFRWYDGYYGNVWAPDNSYRILYQIGEELGAYQPCILDVLAGTSECLTEVVTWREGQELKTSSYQWLPSGEGISFVAWSNGSSLCTMTLENHQIECPINNTIMVPAKFTADSPTFIIGYRWSPDGRYLSLVVSPSSPFSHEQIYAQIATVAADGSQFQVLGFGGGGQWRPDLNP